jgi:hypothetical protein
LYKQHHHFQRVIKMAEFGLRTLLSTAPNSTATMSASFGFSSAGTFDTIGTPARFHTAGAGETVTGLGINAKNNGGSAAGFAIALYEYVPDGSATVFGTLGARVAYEVSPATIPNDDTFAERLVTLTTPFEMVEGTTYMVCLSTDLANAIITITGPERATANSTERDFDGGLYGGLQDPWAGATLAGGSDPAMFAEYTIDTGAVPTLTLPYTIGPNNGPLYTVTTSDSLATIEAAGFFNGNAGYASLLKTNDVLIINASNGTKMYTVTVDRTSRIISLSTGLTIT